MQISVLKSGSYISVTDGVISRLAGYDGIGLPPQHLITDRGPYQHGENYLDFRLDPRELTLLFNVTSASSDYDLEGKMRSLTTLFRSRSSGNLWMKFTTDYNDTRYAQVSYVDGLQLAHRIGDGRVYRVPVVVRMHEPVFRAASTTSGCSEYQYIVSGCGFTVPTPVPTSIGPDSILSSCSLTYGGTWRTYPIVTITGPATDCVITNTTTSEKLDFTGHTISQGDSYEIDCRYGYKTVKNSAGTNKISELSNDSDLATFHFEANPDSTSGVNVITLQVSKINDLSKVVFTYDVMYTEL